MIFSAIFIISALVFALEVLEIRILSFSAWHYITYMVVAVAVLGFAAAGIVLSTKKNFGNLRKLSFFSSVCFAVSVPFSFFCISKIPLDAMMFNKIYLILFLFADSFMLFLPSFFAGLSLISLFENSGKNVNVYYFFSVIGSVTGCFAALPLMEKFGMEGVLSLTVCCGALSSLLLSKFDVRNRKNFIISVILLLLSISLVPIKNTLFSFRTASSKLLAAVTDEKTPPDYTKWDRAGRVDIVNDAGKLTSLDFFPDAKRGVVTIDGDAATLIYDFSENPEQVAVSLYSTGYLGLQNPDVFIAGLSATDVAAALFWQAKSVTSVEVNKAMIDLMMQKYSTFKNNILKSEQVSISHGEVRDFFEKTDKKYDLIQFSGTDTASALLNGMYIMSETYLYTEEAFKSYIEHLSDDGTLAFMRWIFWPPRETLKVVSTAVAALRELGIEHPENNIVIISDGILASALIKKRPFTWSELSDFTGVVAATKDLRIIYAPGFSAGAGYYAPVFKIANFSTWQGLEFIKSSFGVFFDFVSRGKEGDFIKVYSYNIRPASDDRPFFFNYFHFRDNSFLREIHNVVIDPSIFKLVMLLLTFTLILFLAVSMVFTPLFFMHKEEKNYAPAAQILAFLSIGFGFMFVEMTLIQKFTLLFGDPATSAASAIGILLVFSALGSLFSKKILILFGEKVLFAILMFVLPLMILVYAVLLPHFMAACAGTGFGLKIFLTALFIFPLGFLAGLVLPSSLIIVGEKKPSFVPLAFGAEGAASVLATLFSVIVAMVYGFKFVFVLAAFCYFFAVAAMLYFVKKTAKQQ